MLACDSFLRAAVFGRDRLAVCHLTEAGRLEEIPTSLLAKELAWGPRYALFLPEVGLLLGISPNQDRVFARDLAADRELWSRDFKNLSLHHGLWSSLLGGQVVASLSHHGSTMHLDPATGSTIKTEERLTRFTDTGSYASTGNKCRISDLTEGIENCTIEGQSKTWPIPWKGRVGAMIFHGDGRPRQRARKHRCSVDFAIHDAAGVEQFSLAEVSRVSSVLAVCRDDERDDFRLAFHPPASGRIEVAHLGDLKDGELPGREVAVGMVAAFLSPRYLVTESGVVEID